ncbi:putative holin-like toxin [Parablautia muri]|uniref:putative holin-like toxin n=1 Tax=Parablautia muri TaxID=2320879 RepID=UPI0013715943|nr:putative holin-like toxin [Parablautia muri]
MVYLLHGKPESQAAYPLVFSEGLTLQTKERRALPMITYSDLIQTGIFIVALVGLCYKIFKDKRK